MFHISYLNEKDKGIAKKIQSNIKNWNLNRSESIKNMCNMRQQNLRSGK